MYRFAPIFFIPAGQKNVIRLYPCAACLDRTGCGGLAWGVGPGQAVYRSRKALSREDLSPLLRAFSKKKERR